jgi:cystathionine beta-lyase
MDPFCLPIEHLRDRRDAKWHWHDGDVLPAWVADMDFTVAPPVHRAIARSVERQDYGYPYRRGDHRLEPAFAARMAERFGWRIEEPRVKPIGDLVQAIVAALTAFSDPGDGVVVQTPIYPPFLRTIADAGRRAVLSPLVDDGSRMVLDMDDLRRVVDERTRLLLLCNPHNPAGRVFEREELEAIGRLAIERDIVIVSDEIHCDLVYPGHRHVPIGSLSEDIGARTLTLNSATKGFNIAGLRCAVMYFGSDALLARFERAIPSRLLGSVSGLGIDATVAAWREGQPWLDQVMRRLEANRDRVTAWVAETAPAIRHHRPEATYLAWLDFRDVGLPGPSPQRFFLDGARVALSAGADFGAEGESCVRLNFATSPEILELILERMSGALDR